MTDTIIDKWVIHIDGDDDIFIHQVWLKQTPKLWMLKPFDHGEGKNTAIGFDGTKCYITSLLQWKSRFSRGDSRFYDTYEEAREALHKRLIERREAAERKLKKCGKLLDLFNSVPYEKQD